ncbi:hypothetical protein IAU60_003896 [Kwoniella sp. DSM 27419]
MGADGGSIPDRRDLVKTKAKTEQTDKALLRELYFLCALSRRPLSRPVVLDPLGKLYNKDALLEYFIDKSKFGDGEQICGYLKGLKDLVTLNLASNPDYTAPSASTTSNVPTRAPFVCPLSLREMSGSVPFIALRHCGCTFSDAALRGIVPNLVRSMGPASNPKDDTPEEAKPVSPGAADKKEVACPNCGKAFDPTASNAIIAINPPREVQEVLLESLLIARAATKTKKRKNVEKAGVDGIDAAAVSSEPPTKSAKVKSSAQPTINAPTINGPRSVQEKLAEQEKKRLKAQEGMSEAVKAMFKPKEVPGGKKSAADEFFGRTFTRVASTHSRTTRGDATVMLRSDKPNPLLNLVSLVRSLLLDRRYFWLLAGMILLGEAVLGVLIIWKVPYTKIDFPAYMQQVQMFLDGERDYSRIEGETGPLVYPALHLYIYTALYKYLPSADNVRPAQYLFLVIYLATFVAVATIYYLAGRPARAAQTKQKELHTKIEHSRHYPQILLIPLVLSKRIHSIFLLRLFNDPIAMLLMYCAVISMMLGGKKGWRIGCVLYSLALGVKMNILLFLPGLLVLLFQYRGVLGTLEGVTIITTIQLLLPLPYFLSLSNPSLSHKYFTSAFDLSRQFLYEWTVNWRFLSEENFLSRQRAVSLLAAHLFFVIWCAAFNWSPEPVGNLKALVRGFQNWSRPAADVAIFPSHHIPLVLFTANLIGILFARSLHYQFQSWYFHQLPFLLYSGRLRRYPITAAMIWLVIEYAWEFTPATPLSSLGLFVGHWLLLAAICFRTYSSQSEATAIARKVQ